MKNRKGFSINQALLIGMAIIWCVSFLVGKEYADMRENYWVAFGFGLAGFVIAEICCFLSLNGYRDNEEVTYVPAYYTVGYAALMIVGNVLSVLINIPTVIVVVFGLFISFMYIFLFLHVSHYIGRNNMIIRETANKNSRYMDAKQVLNSVINSAENAEIRKQLLRLKEMMDMSDSIVKNQSVETEEQFMQKIYQIYTDLMNGASYEVVEQHIKEATKLWQLRNSLSN